MSNHYTIYSVIGANYGDEGKGLTTDYLAEKLLNEGKHPIVFCNNGGSQRGHTVVRDGITHIFHHFGSGTLLRVPTFLGPDYIINPITCIQEFEELKKKGVNYFNLKIHSDCIMSTPFDMILNLMDKRYKNKTCGLGIWETILRNRMYNINDFFIYRNLVDLYNNSSEEIFAEQVQLNLIDIRDNYFLNELPERNIYYISDEWQEVCFSDGLIRHFTEDLIQFMQISQEYGTNTLQNVFKDLNVDSIIIENGQGLAISGNVDTKYGTPSKTGSQNTAVLLQLFEKSKIEFHADITNYYVSRWYLSRHGDGNFPEYDYGAKDPVHSVITHFIKEFEQTNVKNPNQGEFRIGYFYNDESIEDFLDRINNDLNWLRDYVKKTLTYTSYNNSVSIDSVVGIDDKIIVTHMDEADKLLTNNDIYEMLGEPFFGQVSIDLLSFGKAAKDIKEY